MNITHIDKQIQLLAKVRDILAGIETPGWSVTSTTECLNGILVQIQPDLNPDLVEMSEDDLSNLLLSSRIDAGHPMFSLRQICGVLRGTTELETLVVIHSR